MRYLTVTLLCLFLTGCTSALHTKAAPVAISPQNVNEFNHYYRQFLQHYLGCPDHPESLAECQTGAAFIDTENYEHARKAAQKLFLLRE